MRPRTLGEVAELTLQGGPFHLALAEFLDEFYREPRPEAFEAEPKRLKEAFTDRGEIDDAYLAATAEMLCQQYGFGIPDWVKSPSRALRHPWFASSLGSLRAVLIHESPAAFRCRNLFVSANALTRV